MAMDGRPTFCKDAGMASVFARLSFAQISGVRSCTLVHSLSNFLRRAPWCIISHARVVQGHSRWREIARGNQAARKLHGESGRELPAQSTAYSVRLRRGAPQSCGFRESVVTLQPRIQRKVLKREVSGY